MPVNIEFKENEMIAYISGELDHHTAKSIRAVIDAGIESKKPQKVFLDFSGVAFMDSSGIGLVMGRYKVMQNIWGSVIIANPPSHIKKIMHIAGLDKNAYIK